MTGVATALPQALDDGQVVSRAMDSEKNWQIRFEQDDALVFSLAPNGTVNMRAMRRAEWDAILAANEVSARREAVSDVVRHLMSGDNATRSKLSKMPGTFRA